MDQHHQGVGLGVEEAPDNMSHGLLDSELFAGCHDVTVEAEELISQEEDDDEGGADADTEEWSE